MKIGTACKNFGGKFRSLVGHCADIKPTATVTIENQQEAFITSKSSETPTNDHKKGPETSETLYQAHVEKDVSSIYIW